MRAVESPIPEAAPVIVMSLSARDGGMVWKDYSNRSFCYIWRQGRNLNGNPTRLARCCYEDNVCKDSAKYCISDQVWVLCTSMAGKLSRMVPPVRGDQGKVTTDRARFLSENIV